ncbi:hypothetical protein BU17DRAFT_51482, partial [Hysterangium stoloniferum]
ADRKLPNQSGDGLPPSPSRENPGAVYPKSSPLSAIPKQCLGQKECRRIHGVFYPIHMLSNQELAIMEKFKLWRRELDSLKPYRKSCRRRGKGLR